MNAQVKPLPKPRTLGEWLHAANCPVPQEWMWDQPLSKHPFWHQILGLNLHAMNPRYLVAWDMGTGKTFLAQAHALWLVGMGNKSVMVAPPTLLKQYEVSLAANFPGILDQISFGLYAGDVPQKQALLDKWEATGWPDLLVMSYRSFVGVGPSALYKKALEVRDEEEARRRKEALMEAASWAKDQAERFVLNTLQVAIDENVSSPRERKLLFSLYPRFDHHPTSMSLNFRHLLDRGYSDVKVDEATALKSHASQLNKAVKTFAGRASETNGVTLMTGTPLENTIQDAYGYFHIIDSARYGSKKGFDRVHVERDEETVQPLRFLNLDYMWEGFRKISHRVMKKDVIDLPPKVITEIPLELAPDHKKIYDTLVKERVLEFADGSIIDATTAQACYQIMQQILLNPETYTDKGVKENVLLSALDELVEELAGKKVVIYCWYQQTVEKLCQHFAKQGVARLYGKVSGAERDQEIQRFIGDPACQIFVIQTRAGGLGVDGLQTVCSHAVFAEIPTVPGLFHQAVDRLNRIGQTESVSVYLLVALKTVAVKLRNSLVSKEAEVNQVVRDKKVLLADLMGEEGLNGSLE